MTYGDHDGSNTYRSPDLSPLCRVCEDTDCGKSIDACSICGEDHHEDGPLCGPCDSAEMEKEERAAAMRDAYEADAFDRAGGR